MSSVFDFLFQGSPPPSVTTATTSQQGFPDWYQELMRANIGQATAVASQPYQPYPGQQLAQPTAPTQQAYQMTQQNIGSQNPSLNQASSALTQTAQGFNPNTFQQNYMNPYTQDVANTIQTLGNRNLIENVLPGVNDTFTGAGQFGSSRNADFTNRAIRDNQTAISQAQGSALSQGYQNSMQDYLQNMQNQTLAGQQLGTLGQVYQNTGLKDASAMDQIGQEQQAQTQSGLNIAYQNYQNQLAYPYNNMNFLNSIIRGMPAPTQSQGTTLAPQSPYSQIANPSPLGQAATTYGNFAANGLGNLAGSSVTPAPII